MSLPAVYLAQAQAEVDKVVIFAVQHGRRSAKVWQGGVQ